MRWKLRGKGRRSIDRALLERIEHASGLERDLHDETREWRNLVEAALPYLRMYLAYVARAGAEPHRQKLALLVRDVEQALR